MTKSSTKQPYLTVRDLIEQLQQKPQDAKVFVRSYGFTSSDFAKPAHSLKLTNDPIGNVVTILGE